MTPLILLSALLAHFVAAEFHVRLVDQSGAVVGNESRQVWGRVEVAENDGPWSAICASKDGEEDGPRGRALPNHIDASVVCNALKKHYRCERVDQDISDCELIRGAPACSGGRGDTLALACSPPPSNLKSRCGGKGAVNTLINIISPTQLKTTTTTTTPKPTTTTTTPKPTTTTPKPTTTTSKPTTTTPKTTTTTTKTTTITAEVITSTSTAKPTTTTKEDTLPAPTRIAEPVLLSELIPVSTGPVPQNFGASIWGTYPQCEPNKLSE